MKKNCELCKRVARMYCESDQANLCWSCDLNVHSANFLVARHSRTLLCHVCQTPTPWTATGSSFGPTISVCVNCFKSYNMSSLDDEQSQAQSDSLDEEEEVGNCDIKVVAWPVSTPPVDNEEEGGESCCSSSSSSSPPHVGAKRRVKRKRETDFDFRLNRQRRRMVVRRGAGFFVVSSEESCLTTRKSGSDNPVRHLDLN